MTNKKLIFLGLMFVNNSIYYNRGYTVHGENFTIQKGCNSYYNISDGKKKHTAIYKSDISGTVKVKVK